MSRKTTNPAAERAAQNAQTIKSLLRLDWNKTCADCKRNKHPRWASWNLGVFICIRCSGIHRGMGTHISRVKSVDLDAWTDEQLQSILKWGNSRANKYWEAKLSADHVPSEAKIENFIRTKYESKRWVMDGPIPDPSTLGLDEDDNLPLSLVKEKQSIERSTLQGIKSDQDVRFPQSKGMQQPDLLESNISIFSGENLLSPSINKLKLKADAAPPKQTKPVDSLLGLDFFGTGSAPLSRPTNSLPMTGVQSRPDLKQSILSLYATAPRPQEQQLSQSTQNVFGVIQSPAMSPDRKISLTNITDAFNSLTFPSQKSYKTTETARIQSGSPATSDLGNKITHKTGLSNATVEPSQGDFFSNNTTIKPKRVPPQSSSGYSISSEFSAFISASGPSPTMATNSGSGFGDIFDLAIPTSIPQNTVPASQQTIVSPKIQQNSIFNLTQANPPQSKATLTSVNTNLISNNDAWGSNDVWASVKSSSPKIKTMGLQTGFDESGWETSSRSMLPNTSIISHGDTEGGKRITGNGNTIPVVSADEEFGGWGSIKSTSVLPSISSPVKKSEVPHKPAAGFAGNDDLFSNVWG